MDYDLTKLVQLSNAQYDRAIRQTEIRTQGKIGKKPEWSDYTREFAPLFGVLEVLATVIFIAALIVSTVHSMTATGTEASRVYNLLETETTVQHGVVFAGWLFVSSHQLAFIAMSEASMLLFFVLARLNTGFIRLLSSFIASLATLFILVVNLAGGMDFLMSLLAPAFTIGIGFVLERIIAEMLRRNAEIESKYRPALERWEAATADIRNHEDYKSLRAQCLWEELLKVKVKRQLVNKDFEDAPTAFKRAAVWRELQREKWAQDMGEQGTPAGAVGEGVHISPLAFQTPTASKPAPTGD